MGAAVKQLEHKRTCMRGGYLSPGVAVFIYPWAFMALVAALVMHVQVRWGSSRAQSGGGSSSTQRGHGCPDRARAGAV